MTARFPGVCAKTKAPIKKGDRVFYYPSTRSMFAGEAAKEAERDFQNCVAAETGGCSW